MTSQLRIRSCYFHHIAHKNVERLSKTGDLTSQQRRSPPPLGYCFVSGQNISTIILGSNSPVAGQGHCRSD